MDLELSSQQNERMQLARAVFQGLQRDDRCGHDARVAAAIAEARLLDDIALLDAVLIAEEAARAELRWPIASRAMFSGVLPAVLDSDLVVPVREDADVPSRYGGQADWVLLIGNAHAHLARPEHADPVDANYGFPLARVRAGPSRRWVMPSRDAMMRWRLAIGAEIVGNLDAALSQVTSYLRERQQFGVRLGSMQALQHRLAEHAVSVESVRWLVRDAAWQADAGAAAVAASAAARTARALCSDSHQLCGARGFALEFGLERMSLRLQFLSLEAGGAALHEMVAADLVWSDPK